MTSASRLWQWGHSGSSGRAVSGLLLGRGGRKPLLLQAAQHREGGLVDSAGPGAPAPRVPPLPIDLELRSLRLELLLQARAQLDWSEAQRAALVQLRGVTVGWPEPRDRLAPRFLEGS